MQHLPEVGMIKILLSDILVLLSTDHIVVAMNVPTQDDQEISLIIVLSLSSKSRVEARSLTKSPPNQQQLQYGYCTLENFQVSREAPDFCETRRKTRQLLVEVARAGAHN
jgi:hypothetical protein